MNEPQYAARPWKFRLKVGMKIDIFPSYCLNTPYTPHPTQDFSSLQLSSHYFSSYLISLRIFLLQPPSHSEISSDIIIK